MNNIYRATKLNKEKQLVGEPSQIIADDLKKVNNYADKIPWRDTNTIVELLIVDKRGSRWQHIMTLPKYDAVGDLLINAYDRC